MRTITAKRKEIDHNEFVRRSALESDFTELIRESIRIVDENGKTLLIYKEIDDLDETEVVKVLQGIKYAEGKRSRGLVSRSRIFGFAPRLEFRQNYCHATSLARENPRANRLVMEYGKTVAQIYFKEEPNEYDTHNKLAEDVLPEYRIQDTPFTSGIVNKNNPLKYHYDTGNFKDVYSCMLGFKHQTTGGYLSLPEFGLGLEIRNNSLLIFDGQNILHGVTPIVSLGKDSYRYTVVYYSLKRMWECLPLNEEIARIRNIRQTVEKRRASGEMAESIIKKMENLTKRSSKESLGDIR